MAGTVLILGANGKIGSHAAAAFWNAGWTVRRFTRGTDMTEAAKGADVIVNGLNPPNYHNWKGIIPQITAEVIAAARANGAAVIVPGNVYNFGTQPGPWGPKVPQVPCSAKGQIRKEMEETYAASGVQTIILRAGDFIDPEQNGDAMSMIQLAKAGKGKVTSFGDPDCPRAYAYLPDWARAAVALADQSEELERFTDVPLPGHTFTIRQLAAHLEATLGRPMAITRFPWWAMTLAAPFWELARELKEMRYLWNTPHSLSGTEMDRLLPGFAAAPLAEVMEAGLPKDVRPDQPVRTGGAAVLAAH